MTILVTGATGFVGSVVARELLARGESVRALARPGSDRRNFHGLTLEIAEGDLRDAASLQRACRGCSGLFHVAADYRLWTPRPQELYDSNVEGTRRLMMAALEAGISRVVYTSSVATLGLNADGSPATEDTPVAEVDMIGHYKRSKFQAERVVDELVAREALPAVIVNPSTPIGPFDVKPTPTGRVIRDAFFGRIPAFVDTGLNLVHVEDVARGHLLAFEKGQVGRRYILGGEDMALREILAAIARLAGRRPPTVELPRLGLMPLAFLAETWARLSGGPEPQLTLDGLRMSRKKMFFDSGRAMRELGYGFRPAQQAIEAAVDWFKRQAGG